MLPFARQTPTGIVVSPQVVVSGDDPDTRTRRSSGRVRSLPAKFQDYAFIKVDADDKRAPVDVAPELPPEGETPAEGATTDTFVEIVIDPGTLLDSDAKADARILDSGGQADATQPDVDQGQDTGRSDQEVTGQEFVVTSGEGEVLVNSQDTSEDVKAVSAAHRTPPKREGVATRTTSNKTPVSSRGPKRRVKSKRLGRVKEEPQDLIREILRAEGGARKGWSKEEKEALAEKYKDYYKEHGEDDKASKEDESAPEELGEQEEEELKENDDGVGEKRRQNSSAGGDGGAYCCRICPYTSKHVAFFAQHMTKVSDMCSAPCFRSTLGAPCVLVNRSTNIVELTRSPWSCTSQCIWCAAACRNTDF